MDHLLNNGKDDSEPPTRGCLDLAVLPPGTLPNLAVRDQVKFERIALRRNSRKHMNRTPDNTGGNAVFCVSSWRVVGGNSISLQ